MQRDLAVVHLPSHQVVEQAHPGKVIFPRNAVISIVTRLSDGQTVENAMVGYEGAWRVAGQRSQIEGMVQIAGDADVLSAEAWQKHQKNDEIQAAMSRDSERLFMFSCQSCACQVFHTAEQRLARWLLEVRDRIETDQLPLTQEFIAAMLGVQRPTVTLAARILQAAEMIRYRHGRVTVVDRAALEEAACECYQLVRGGHEKDHP